MITALKNGDPPPKVERAQVRIEQLIISEGTAEEAINIGLARSSGDVFCFVGSDDIIMRLDLVAMTFERLAKIDAVYGDCLITSPGRKERVYRNPNPEKLTEHLRYGCCATAPFFFRRRFFDSVGGFDASMKSAADYDFLIRATKADMRFAKLSGIFYVWNQKRDSRSLVGKRDSELVRTKHRDFVKPKFTTFGGLKYSALWRIGL